MQDQSKWQCWHWSIPWDGSTDSWMCSWSLPELPSNLELWHHWWHVLQCQSSYKKQGAQELGSAIYKLNETFATSNGWGIDICLISSYHPFNSHLMKWSISLGNNPFFAWDFTSNWACFDDAAAILMALGSFYLTPFFSHQVSQIAYID